MIWCLFLSPESLMGTGKKEGGTSHTEPKDDHFSFVVDI